MLFFSKIISDTSAGHPQIGEGVTKSQIERNTAGFVNFFFEIQTLLNTKLINPNYAAQIQKIYKNNSFINLLISGLSLCRSIFTHSESGVIGHCMFSSFFASIKSILGLFLA